MSSKIQYVCNNCGSTHSKMMGRCPACGEYGTIEENIIKSDSRERKESSKRRKMSTSARSPSQIDDTEYARLKLFSSELNQVLGGGLIDGTIILLGGSPGSGKTTLSTQIAGDLSNRGEKILYISGEESAQQIKYRLNKFNFSSNNFLILESDNIQDILDEAELTKPRLMIIDSIQTIHSDTLDSTAGTVSQIRECAARLQWFGKNNNISVIIIGHVTKDNTIAGPKILEHLVDVTLYLESDDYGNYRILRSIKNRFGSSPEIGIFEMDNNGLRDVLDPSGVFMSEHSSGISGASIGVMMEGSRGILSEVQSLVDDNEYASPMRSSTGLDRQRMTMIASVLAKHAKVPFYSRNITVNIVGGVFTKDVALDLPMAVAMLSSYLKLSIPVEIAAIGQIDLPGRIRSVPQITQRVQAAAKIGINHFILPSIKGGYSFSKDSGIIVHEIKHVSDLIPLINTISVS